MTIKSIHKSLIGGNITAPSSKSYAQRAIIAAALAKGTSTLSNITLCEDVKAALSIISDLGVDYSEHNGIYTIKSDGVEALNTKNGNLCLNINESGLLARIMMPLISVLTPKTLKNTLNGSGSIIERPMTESINAIKLLGGKVEQTTNSSLPLDIYGGLNGGEITVDGSISSQFLTGLLMSLSVAEKDSIITVTSLKSRPYIDMTIDVLSQFGIVIENDDYKRFIVKGGQQYKPARDYEIEGDWSSAAYILTAAAMAGEVTMEKLSARTKQADKAILHALDYAGAKLSLSWDSVSVSRAYRMEGFSFDATNCPDLIPALVALASGCKGESTIVGSERLKYKESNRTEALRDVYNKLGIELDCSYDNVIIVKGGEIKGGVEINPYNDHRIAMSVAIAALRAETEVVITNSECVNKSYPEFWNDLLCIIKNDENR